MVVSLVAAVLAAGCNSKEASIHPAVAQGGCPPMQVPVGDGCQLAKEVKALLPNDQPTPAQEVKGPEADDSDKMEILAVLTFKKGEGCMAATARTPYKMSKSQCAAFLAKHGMKPWVDHRNPMMQIEREAIVPEWTEFVYVQSKQFTGWTITDKD